MSDNNLRIRSASFVVGAFLSATLAFAQTPSFKPAQAYAVGTTPVSATVGDFNGDGIPDIAVANGGSNNLSVLLGKGDGTFGPAVNFDAGVSPGRVVVADINGDGKPDIAVLVNVNLDISAPGAMSMLLGNGDGTFQPPIVSTLTLEQNPFALIDVNGDKKADLIINLIDSWDDPTGVTVALGNGDGTFQASTTIANAPGVSLVADLNGDGRPDLAVNAGAYFQLMYGKGDGTFSVGPQLSPSDGGGVGRIWAGDLNNDGKLDLILESYLDSGTINETNVQQDIGAFLNNGSGFGGERIFLTGVFQKANPFAPETYSLISDIAIGDFNGDGHADVADRAAVLRTSNPPFAVNVGDGAGNFTAVAMNDPGPFAIAADLNGDQLADLVVFDAGNNSIRVLVNSTPTFTMVAGNSTLTADAGQQVTDALTFTAFNGFSSSVQLSCQVVGPAPAAPTCSLSPSSIATGGGTSTLTVTVASAQGSLLPLELLPPPPPFFAVALGISLLALLYAVNATRTAPRGQWRGALTAGIMLICSSCGGSSSRSITPPPLQQYSVIVTGASSTLTKTLSISLTAP
jgi:large repetitive protein